MLSHLQEFCFKSLDLHGPNIDPAQAWMIKIVELFYTMKNLLQIFFQTHTILMSGSGYGGWISWQGLELGTSMLSSQDFDHSWLTTWIPKLGCHIASRETCYILYQVTISSHHTVIKFMTCHIFFFFSWWHLVQKCTKFFLKFFIYFLNVINLLIKLIKKYSFWPYTSLFVLCTRRLIPRG